MEIRELRVVVVLAEELHFGRAAERLHIGQPALSQQLRRLERRLGLQLFERSTHHVRLTPAGQTFVHHARPVLAGVETLTEVVAGLADGTSLRVGSLAPTYDVPRILVAGLAEALADVEVTEVMLPGFSAGRQALLDGQVEVYLGPLGEGTGLESLPLRSDRFGLWLPPGHPIAARAEVRIAEVADLPVQVDPGRLSPEIVSLVERMYAAAGARLQRLPGSSGSMFAALIALSSGGDPLVGPLQEPIPAGVTWVPYADPHAHAAMHLVWRAGDERDVVRRTVEATRAIAAAQGWLVRDERGTVIT